MKVAAVIAARNEAPTIGNVVDAARGADLVDEVIVVDNASSDDTGEIAANGGATVVSWDQPGKGEAMRAGVQATDAEVIVFLDGDLIGLRSDHVDRLVQPVLEGRAGMVCGLFDRNRWLNPVFLKALPILTGERAVRRQIFERLEERDLTGYSIEAALNAACSDLNVRTIAFICDGMWHRTKEEKYSTPLEGHVRKLAMLLTAVAGYAGYLLRHRLFSPSRRARDVKAEAA